MRKYESLVHFFIRHLILVTVGPVEGHFSLQLQWREVLYVFNGGVRAFRIIRALSFSAWVIRGFSDSIFSASELFVAWFHWQLELGKIFEGHRWLFLLTVRWVWLNESGIGVGETEFSILQWELKHWKISSVRSFRLYTLFFSSRGHDVLLILHQLFDLRLNDSWDEKLPRHLLERCNRIFGGRLFDIRVRGLGIGVFCIVCHF